MARVASKTIPKKISAICFVQFSCSCNNTRDRVHAWESWSLACEPCSFRTMEAGRSIGADGPDSDGDDDMVDAAGTIMAEAFATALVATEPHRCSRSRPRRYGRDAR